MFIETITVSGFAFPTNPCIFTVRQQQSESNGYLPPYSTQRPPEKPRPFQTASQQNEVTGYPAQRPSSLYTPPNIGYPGSGQPSTPFSTPRPSQQPSSTYVPQGFRGSTSYNPRPSQPSYTNAGSSAFPPLNPPESSSTYLPPQPPPFPSTSPRLPSESMIGKFLSLSAGIDSDIQISKDNTVKEVLSVTPEAIQNQIY